MGAARRDPVLAAIVHVDSPDDGEPPLIARCVRGDYGSGRGSDRSVICQCTLNPTWALRSRRNCSPE